MENYAPRCKHVGTDNENNIICKRGISSCLGCPDYLTTQKAPVAESPLQCGVIKLCPHCGNDNIGIHTHVEGRMFAQRQNQFCGASGGMCDSKEEAIKIWNRRVL